MNTRRIELSRRTFLAGTALATMKAGPAATPAGSLDPRGRMHIPIGIPNTVDTLKTFVEAEGNFSPGVGSYGIYFWLFDRDSGELTAPTADGVPVNHGLAPGGLPIPWSEWRAGDITVRTEVCSVELEAPAGRIIVTGARASITNKGARAREVGLYAALRPLGPAGWDVRELEMDAAGDLMLVDGHTAIRADRKPASAGVVATDTIGQFALQGKAPDARRVQSAAGDCSGAMLFDFVLAPHATEQIGFVCPVLPGRRAARHQWTDLHFDAMADVAELNPKQGGILQPDPEPAYFRDLRVDALFQKAGEFWRSFLEGIEVRTPDPRWGEGMRAILAHAGICMNEGAPDVAVANYNVFNRDGMYIANMMQKSGRFGLSRQVVDYFVAHPFNGRAYPEADNPGQILWAIHQHWLLTRDLAWLREKFPAAEQVAEMIRYYRTTPGPHWVSTRRLAFGNDLAASEREELKPGRCDGLHPEYTEAFDIAGLRSAADLAEALGKTEQAASWRSLAQRLFAAYDERFGAHLAREYGSYGVMWPCRLYPYGSGKAHDQFQNTGAQQPTSWRYFPLATAHQGLLAGNRAAGHGTLQIHLAHEQMRGWYAFDEGGGSGSGGWHRLRTRWPCDRSKPGSNSSVAMPHGWALAEFWLLMRDSIAFEDGNRIVLFGGVPEAWFRAAEGMAAKGLATYFGPLDIVYRRIPEGAGVRVAGSSPPEGHVLRLPPSLGATVWRGSEQLFINRDGDCLLPPGTREVRLRFS
ncbi:MAG: hypothetical protein U0Q18_02335 [Bryobacteraceae bacterium]